MKNFVIVDGTLFKIIDGDAYACAWDYNVPELVIDEEPAELEIPDTKYTYEEVYKKFNVAFFIKEYEQPQFEANVTVEPSTSSQTITPSKGYDAISSVTVSAVTSAIDSNITAENIKSGVTILGVEGTYSAETPAEPEN